MNITIDETQNQYSKFETLFVSNRRDNITKLLDNLSKKDMIAILDSYDEMVQIVAPDVISIEDCVKRAIDNGQLETSIYDSNNSFRQLAIDTITAIEDELYDILPEPNINEIPPENNDSLTKIFGYAYYSLEDRLTNLFKDHDIF
jgi:molecular chaperone GrpE (heat shock protein)